MTLIIFDVDGTLVHTTDRQDSRSYALTYERLYGKPFPTIDWRYYPHVTDTAIFQAVVGDHFRRRPEEAEISIFQEHYISCMKEKREQYPADYREVPGAKRAVAYLQEAGFAFGVATGGWVRPAKVKLQHVGIPAEEFLISGADGKTTREDIIEELLANARHRFGSFEKIVYVGDEIWDVHTTRNLRLGFIGIRRRNDPETLLEAGAKTVLTDYLDFPRFLQAVREAEVPGGGKGY
jgi:phosphoglycolate phosphatase-like HAD superfamily hydrolase